MKNKNLEYFITNSYSLTKESFDCSEFLRRINLEIAKKLIKVPGLCWELVCQNDFPIGFSKFISFIFSNLACFNLTDYIWHFVKLQGISLAYVTEIYERDNDTSGWNATDVYQLSSNATRKVNDTRYMGGCRSTSTASRMSAARDRNVAAAVSWAVCLRWSMLRPRINKPVPFFSETLTAIVPWRSSNQAPRLARASSLM